MASESSEIATKFDAQAAREQVLRDIGERTVMLMDIERGTRDRKGLFRNIGRFLFRHDEWQEDRLWLYERRTAPESLRLMNIVSHSVLQDVTEGGMGYYDVLQEMNGMHYFRRRISETSLQLPETPTE